MNIFRIFVFFIVLTVSNLFAHKALEQIDLSKVPWEYSWGDDLSNKKENSWNSIEYPSNPPNRLEQNNVWYRVKIPARLPKDPHLYIYSIDLITEVYFQNKKIYQFGTFDKNGKGKFEGWPWHMIKLPEGIEEKYLYFRIYSNYPDIGLWGEISIASKGFHLQRMLDNDLLKLSIGVLAGFVGLLFLILYITNQKKLELFLLSSLFLTQGIDLLISTKVIQLYFFYPLLKQYLLAFCYFFVPVGIAALLEYFIGAGPFNIIRRIWQFHLGYIIVSFIGAVIGFYNVSSLYVYFDYFHYFFTFPILTIIMLFAMIKGGKELRIISIGFFILSLSWLYSSLIAWGLIEWREHPSYVAVLLCLTLFSYVIVQKVMVTQKIEKQKEEFESIFKYSKDGIAIVDLHSRFLKFNDAYLELTGYTQDELLTKSCIELSDPKEQQKNNQVIKEVLEKGFIEHFEKTYITKDGRRKDVNIAISMLPDKKRLLLVAKDVTSLKNIENQSRLIAMGEMIGNIAHQWRQPLSMITTSASGMKLKLEYEMFDQKTFIELTDIIIKQSEYLSETINNFRDFIKGDATFTKVSIIETIQKSISLVNDSIKDNYIKLVKDLNEDKIIFGSQNQISQCIINIINNAIYALKEKVPNEDDRLIIIKTKMKGEKIEILIKDSAGGIDTSILERIFEPYFTTKHQSVGTGLGLSIVDKIIRERHSGEIKAYNEQFEYNGKKYEGVCFSVVLG